LRNKQLNIRITTFNWHSCTHLYIFIHNFTLLWTKVCWNLPWNCNSADSKNCTKIWS